MTSANIDTYGVLAGNFVDLNFGTSRITGDLGSFNAINVAPGASVLVSGATNIGTSINDALNYSSLVYNTFIGYTPDTTTSTSNIAGMSFNIGIHALTNSSVIIGGATPQITLDGYGAYLFQVPNGDLTTDPTSGPVFFNFLNGAKPSDVYWVINGNVNLQTITNITTFAGTVLCTGNITMGLSSSNSDGLIAFSSSPNGIITLNQNVVICRNSQILLEKISNDYINIETTLSDNRAIRINAANVNGGILMNAGFGGIEIDTTNSISMNANAASNLSTTLGNIDIQSQPALVNIDAGTGINVGCDNNMHNTSTPIITPLVNIGTSASAKTINIGNTTGATAVNINSASGGVTINSSTGQVNIVGNNSSVSAINLDASSGSNGINMSSGSGGLAVNSTGQVSITTSNGLGLESGGSGISLTTGSSGGSTLINYWGGGSILVAANQNPIAPQEIVIGNNQSATVIERWGNSGCLIQHQSPETALSSGDTAITGAQLLVRIITINSTSGSLSLPTAADIKSAMNSISGFLGTQLNDSIDFTIVNTNTSNSLTLTTAETVIGNLIIPASASGAFRLRITNITGGSEAYTIYRIS